MSTQRTIDKPMARQNIISLPECLERRRIVRAFESRLTGLIERLHEHGEQVAHLARAGSVLAERLAALVRTKRLHVTHIRRSGRQN